MAIKIDNNNDKLSICIDGDLTIYTVQEYKKSLVENISTDIKLDLDLSDVDEIDSSGLQLLAAIAKHTSDTNGELAVTSASDVVTEALKTNRLLAYMKIDSEGMPT